MPLITPQIQHVLDAETDARFWASTAYRPGQKLNPVDLKDRAMIPVWVDIANKVKAQWQAGILVTTYDHPVVTAAIAAAHDAFETAAAHVNAALASVMPDDKNAHAVAAAASHADAQASAAKAASYQPATASPQLAQKAAKTIYEQVVANRDAMVARGPHAPDLQFGLEFGHATVTPDVPPNPTPDARATLDALQAAHAPAAVAATYTQTPAPDAPDATTSKSAPSLGTTMLIVGCIAVAIGVASSLSSHRDEYGRRTA